MRFVVRQQVTLTNPLYDRRQKTVSQIPNFWPLVLEQAPPEIDQYIQPSDSALLLSSLTSLSILHFQISPASATPDPDSDPRSFSIRMEFGPNEYFEDSILEKKFWHRRARNGWQGLVSEPVNINWKKGKDLTGGLLDLVCKAWDAEKATSSANGTETPAKKEPSAEQKALRKKIDSTSMGGLSFFAWFGFIGRKVSAEESVEAGKKEAERRARWRRGEKVPIEELEEDEGDDDDEISLDLEIFPDGDELAVAFKEDLWVDAIKYFSRFLSLLYRVFELDANKAIAQAQEQDALSDTDFESDDEGLDGLEGSDLGDSGEERPAKKRKN